MNQIKIFENTEFGQIRTLTINSEPWFVGKDIDEKLGYSDPSSAVSKRVDKVDKTTLPIRQDGSNYQTNITVINESGLYSLILGSKLESAKRFKHWVTSEVLPSIRKNGAYMTEDTLEKALTSPDFLIQLATKLKEEKEKTKFLENQVVESQKVIEEMIPKVRYYDLILNSNSLVTTTQIAKDYGMSARRLNTLLNSYGVQYKVNKQWVVYSKYQAEGYTHSETISIPLSDETVHVVMETKWTQKGRLFLYELLKKNGLIPVIER